MAAGKAERARVAIVTASGRGIGAACARQLAHKGYRVALMSRSEDALKLSLELGGIGIRGSVESYEDLRSLVKLALEFTGVIDVVVNNTGDPPQGDLLDLSDDQWISSLDLLLLNVQRMAKLVTPAMQAQGFGSIINISAADAREPDLRFPIGSTLRAALGAWTKLYSNRYASAGIRMNCVSPGIVMPEGPLLTREDFASRVPMGRAATYDEIAATVCFLASDESRYITGQDIRVDGGLTKYI